MSEQSRNHENHPRGSGGKLSGLCAVILIVFGVSLLLDPSAYGSADQKASAFVLCKNKKDVRTIRILPEGQTTDKCMITYSKGASEEVVGTHRSASSCSSILKNIQYNLEASKWSCRSVPSARVTTGSEVIHQ